jgi:hypothetical protein
MMKRVSSKPKDRLKLLRRTPLEQIGAPARVSNSLSHYGHVADVNDVLRRSPRQLLRIRQFGPVGLGELLICLLRATRPYSVAKSHSATATGGDPAALQALGLSPQLVDAVRAAGVRTPTDLKTGRLEWLLELPQLDESTARQLVRAILASLGYTHRTQLEAVWGSARWRSVDVRERTFMRAFRAAVDASVRDNRESEIILSRIGAAGRNFLTLEELAAKFGVSRQRIHQMEQTVIKRLRGGLMSGGLAGVDWANEARRLRDVLVTGPEVVTEVELLQRVEKQVGLEAEDLDYVALLLTILGLRRLPGRGHLVRPAWITDPVFDEAPMLAVIERASRILNRTWRPVPLGELRQRIKPPPAMSDRQIRQALAMCLSAEFVSRTDSYQLPFALLRSHAARACRLLYEHGEPLHSHELTRRANNRLKAAGRSPTNSRSLVTQLTPHPDVAPIGRTGLWALREWSHVSARSVADQIEDALRTFDRPASPDEIFKFIRARRPVSRSSVDIYLRSDQRFVRTGRGQYELTSWLARDSRGNRVDVELSAVEDVVRGIYDSNGDGRLDLAKLTRAVSQEFGLTPQSAEQVLLSSGVVREAPDDRGAAVYEPNVRERGKARNRAFHVLR